MKKIVATKNAPEAIGPYSQAVIAGNTLYISGQIPLNPETGEMVGSDIKSQTKQVFKNIDGILKEAGLTSDNVVKCTVLLQNIEDFAEMNAVYGDFFNEPYPARAAFAVKSLPKNALVEIEVIAAL